MAGARPLLPDPSTLGAAAEREAGEDEASDDGEAFAHDSQFSGSCGALGGRILKLAASSTFSHSFVVRKQGEPLNRKRVGLWLEDGENYTGRMDLKPLLDLPQEVKHVAFEEVILPQSLADQTAGNANAIIFRAWSRALSSQSG